MACIGRSDVRTAGLYTMFDQIKVIREHRSETARLKHGNNYISFLYANIALRIDRDDQNITKNVKISSHFIVTCTLP